MVTPRHQFCYQIFWTIHYLYTRREPLGVHTLVWNHQSSLNVMCSVVFMNAINKTKQQKFPCLIFQSFPKEASDGVQSAAALLLYQSQQHGQPGPCGSLQSRSAGVFSLCTAWVWMCWMRLNRRSAPHNFKAQCGQSAAWCPTDPAHLWVSAQGLPFSVKPPEGFLSLYPGMRSEFQIWIKVGIEITCIRYLLKHIFPALFFLSSVALLVHQKTFYRAFSFSSLLKMTDTSEMAFS